VLVAGCSTTEEMPSFDDVLGPGGKSDAYGSDVRVDLYRTPEAVQIGSRSVAAALSADQIRPISETEVALLPFAFSTDSLAQVMDSRGMPLCESEPFRDQPTRAWGTVFLIAPDLVATARHVAITNPCAKQRFVFDYAYHHDPATRPTGLREITTRPAENVFSCKEVIFPRDPELDIALIRLDRPVRDRFPWPLVTSDDLPPTNEPIAMLGHPTGLPMKFAPPGRVLHRDLPFQVGNTTVTDPDTGFFTNLGAYQGNSGSPVISRRGVEGVLVLGDRDFMWNESERCYVTKLCKEDGSDCGGNYVLRSRHLLEMLD
jgi:hypothetical protein